MGFEGMACKFRMRAKLIEELIDNRLRDKNDKNRNNDYISQIFDFYCNDMTELKIRLSLMDQSYKKISNIFMDHKKSNTLKLEKIIRLFPKCQRIKLWDGYNYQLIPQNTEYGHTILGITENCIQYVNDNKHPLKRIILETSDPIQ